MKYDLTLPDDLDSILHRIAQEHKTTKEELIRAAVKLLFIADRTPLYCDDDKGGIREIYIFQDQQQESEKQA